jgi:dTDP-glucose 4,6-dehydratase
MLGDHLLVTGGCGFIGSNFIRYLLGRTDFHGRIINVDALTYAGNSENLNGVGEAYPGRYFFEKADICDASAIRDIFRRYAVDSICHFAAESHVDRSIRKPVDFIQTNIVGTFTLLEEAKETLSKGHPFYLFHHISTDEVYGSLGQDGYFTEETPYRPNSPYSASKASSDHLVRAYHKTYGLPTTISNCSNNYGPYQFPEKLIPLVVLNGLDGKPLPVYGDGKNIRDWLYVKDHCGAITEIMKNGRSGQTYNIGGSAEIENISIVGMICDMLDELVPSDHSRQELIAFVPDRPGHDRRYAIDFSKIRQELGWKPKESFASGLRKTVLWYVENRRWCERIVTGEYQSWIQENYEQR